MWQLHKNLLFSCVLPSSGVFVFNLSLDFIILEQL